MKLSGTTKQETWVVCPHYIHYCSYYSALSELYNSNPHLHYSSLKIVRALCGATFEEHLKAAIDTNTTAHYLALNLAVQFRLLGFFWGGCFLFWVVQSLLDFLIVFHFLNCVWCRLLWGQIDLAVYKSNKLIQQGIF